MNELQSLSMIFQNKLFRIPDYQRGYAWQEEQLIDFWEDVINLQENRNHYTGLLSIKALSKEDSRRLGDNDQWLLDAGFKAYHIVDGQQRLTTFVICLYELIKFRIDLESNISESEIYLGYESVKDIKAKYISRQMPPDNFRTTYIFGYENDNPSAEYLRYRIFEEKYGGTLKETYYTKNLKAAKEFFSDVILKYYEKKGLNALSCLYKKLTQCLMFNIHDIEDDYDVYVAFETMNNRGKRLSNLELLKNRLIYLTTLYKKSDLTEASEKALREKINDAWKEVYFQLGRNESKPLSDDEFLRAHWIIFFHYSRQKGDDYIKYLLRYFSHKSIFKDIYPKEIPSQIQDLSDEYEEIGDDDNDFEESFDNNPQQNYLKPEDIKNYVNSLKDCSESWYYSFFPNENADLSVNEKLWIDRLNRIGIGYFRPLVSVIINKNTNGTEEEKVELLKAIERFIFVNFRLAVYQSTYKSSDYYKKTKELYDEKISLQEITDDLNELTNQNIENALEIYISKMQHNFTAEGRNGFYDWHSIKYFLFEYEYHLAEELKRTDDMKINWISFTTETKGKYSIEHILPQTPTKFYWRNTYRQFIENTSEMKKLTSSLGNLLPLSKAINSSLQNDSFEEKKIRGYSNGSYSELEVSRETEWTANNIYFRGKKLLSFMENRWNFKFKNEEQKDNLLNISFINDGRNIPAPLEESILKIEDDITIGETAGEKRKAYWSFVLPRLKETLNGPYAHVNPTTSDFSDGYFGVKGIHLFCSIKQRLKRVLVGLWIDTGDAVTSKKLFDLIYKDKEIIESKFKNKLEWNRKNKSRSCSICMILENADFTDKSQWQKLSDFQVKYAKLLSDIIFYPREEAIKKILL